jgi:hypothetical protein
MAAAGPCWLVGEEGAVMRGLREVSDGVGVSKPLSRRKKSANFEIVLEARIARKLRKR